MHDQFFLLSMINEAEWLPSVFIPLNFFFQYVKQLFVNLQSSFVRRSWNVTVATREKTAFNLASVKVVLVNNVQLGRLYFPLRLDSTANRK
jgi:hypothetical protein